MYEVDENDVKAAVSAHTGYPAGEIELRKQQGADGEDQEIWVFPGVDAGYWYTVEDDLGGVTVCVLTANE